MLEALVGVSGLEPPTPTLSGWCSNRLSYTPINAVVRAFLEPNEIGKKIVVEVNGFEPLTPCLQGRCSTS